MKRASAIISLVFLIPPALILVFILLSLSGVDLFAKLRVSGVALIGVLIISIGFSITALLLSILAYRTRKVFSIITGAVSILFLAVVPISIFIVPGKEEPPRFEDFPVSERFEDAPVPVDLSSHPDAQNFQTRLTEGAKEGPNFAGLYTVIEWGCGTGCQNYALVDAKTGAVYFPSMNTSLGAEFRIDSNLFIANHPKYVEEARQAGGPEWLASEYYPWENNQFVLIYPKQR